MYDYAADKKLPQNHFGYLNNAAILLLLKQSLPPSLIGVPRSCTSVPPSLIGVPPSWRSVPRSCTSVPRSWRSVPRSWSGADAMDLGRPNA
jgi:hypothetical protein